MKLTNANIAVIMVAVAGVTAAFTFAVSPEIVSYGAPNTGSAAMMLQGNVKVFHLNGDGDIIGIRQSDNHIVGQGMELIIGQVFDHMNGTADAPTSPVSHMAIGHAGEWEVLMNDTDLRLPLPSVGLPLCVRDDATFANVTSPAAEGFGSATIVRGILGGNHSPCQAPWAGESGGPNSANCAAQGNVTATGIFSGANCAGPLDIDEAGMFNDPAAGIMFARNNFGGVVLNAPDTLRLDWEFTFTDS